MIEKKGIDWEAWVKPTTPTRQFGVVAVFLLIVGLVLQLMLSSRFLVPWGGETRLVSLSVLWGIGAIPFGMFAGLYWLCGERRGMVYDRKLSNIHFGLTVFWLLDLVRLVFGWQTSLLSQTPALEFRDYAIEAGAILAVCMVFFALNLRSAHRGS
jgi:hypothetical protein